MSKRHLGDFKIRVYNPATHQHENHFVAVYVDGQELANAIGAKACANRSGKSKCAGGAVVVERILNHMKI